MYVEVTTRLEAVYTAKCVIIATGTCISGRVYVGDVSYESGPDGMFPSVGLAHPLLKARLKTPALKRYPVESQQRSIDFSSLEPQ